MGTLVSMEVGVVPKLLWKVECPGRHHGCLEDATCVPGSSNGCPMS